MNNKTEPVPRIQVTPSTPTRSTPRREPRDTGFPEPLSRDRNTTLSHPDADVSPNACICQDDIDPARALGRLRRFSLGKNSKRTLQHGKITAQDEAMYSALSLASIDRESDTPKPRSPSLFSVRVSKVGTDSIGSRRDEETPPTSPDVPTHRSKKGFLKKWWKE